MYASATATTILLGNQQSCRIHVRCMPIVIIVGLNRGISSRINSIQCLGGVDLSLDEASIFYWDLFTQISV